MARTVQTKVAFAAGLLAMLEAQGAAINTEPVWAQGESRMDLAPGTYSVVKQPGKFGEFSVVRPDPAHYDIPAGRMVSIVVHRKSDVDEESGCSISLFRASRDFAPTGGGKLIKKGDQKLFAVAG